MYPHHAGGQGPPPNHQQWSQQQTHHHHHQPHEQHPSGHPPQPPNGAPNGYPVSHLPSIQAPPETMQAASQYHHLPAPQRHNMYPNHYNPPPQYPYPQTTQPAPRQRTAIACRYCRRRKIRCSGFENSEDGRCQNCTRFNQECVFTPVSSQTQAFVPAHTVYGRGGHPAGAQLYGAYGQPLPVSQAPPDPYGRGAPQPYPVTSPTGTYGPPPGYRPSDEPHTPNLGPPPPGASRAEHDYRYPDPTALAPGAVSPASSSASFHSAPQANQQTPYYAQPPSVMAHGQPRRSSPTGSGYNYDPSRASSSPHTQPQPGTPYAADAASLRPPSNIPQSRTPPPVTAAGGPSPQQQGTNGHGARPGMSISSIVSGQGNSQEGSSPGTRSAADSDMLNRLR